MVENTWAIIKDYYIYLTLVIFFYDYLHLYFLMIFRQNFSYETMQENDMQFTKAKKSRECPK